jgi:hypothetical protein
MEPAQTTNDLKAIKQKYVGKLAICGGWDNLKYDASEEDELREALIEYVDTFAPGGGFTYMAMGGGPKDDPKAERRRGDHQGRLLELRPRLLQDPRMIPVGARRP